jgi:hypothetical protein
MILENESFDANLNLFLCINTTIGAQKNIEPPKETLEVHSQGLSQGNNNSFDNPIL